MLVEHRTYIVRPGTLNAQLAIYEKYGFEVQKKHLGEPLGWLLTEIGNVNSYVHMWVYQDAADRSRRRAALQADPDWIVYIKKAAEADCIVSQESRLMVPAPFAPLKR